jgi:hypothetical protein
MWRIVHRRTIDVFGPTFQIELSAPFPPNPQFPARLRLIPVACVDRYARRVGGRLSTRRGGGARKETLIPVGAIAGWYKSPLD